MSESFRAGAELFLLQVRSLRECRRDSVEGTFDSPMRHKIVGSAGVRNMVE
jgi:hypothetical protein